MKLPVIDLPILAGWQRGKDVQPRHRRYQFFKPISIELTLVVRIPGFQQTCEIGNIPSFRLLLLLRSEEGLENPPAHLWRDARSAVVDFQCDIVAFGKWDRQCRKEEIGYPELLPFQDGLLFLSYDAC
jgi:hypothetical protein